MSAGHSAANVARPDQDGWPSADLERVHACPVCGSEQRMLLLDRLRDEAFAVAPGEWQLQRCQGCGSAYLDPRPDEASIGRAYGRYFTHAPGAYRTPDAQLVGFRRLRRALVNGYSNQRYGTGYRPALAVGAWLARLLPMLARPLDHAYRQLPRPRPGQRLLDVGCGNGDFLERAHVAGWDASGVELDPAAAEVARGRGFNVHVGALDGLDALSGAFDVITLNHVIEHLHDPAQALRHVHRLLRDGGTLYLETPNIDSDGARRFGRHWRGLEAPRHLVLFTPASLAGLLSACGFKVMKFHDRPQVALETWLASTRMAQGHPPEASQPPALPALQRWWLRWRPLSRRRLEFVTLSARKVGA